MCSNIGLVLEGGGSRGVYTAGVLQYLMKHQIYLPYVIGASSGACHGSSYISRQMDRNKKVSIDYVRHPDYLSIRNLLKKRQLFGMDFIFDQLPNQLVPFDFATFQQAKESFVVTATDCMTGEAVYYDKKHHAKDVLTLIRASSSLPLAAPIVHYQGRALMDGGISNPIPIKQSIRAGNTKNVVVLTRNRGYVKKPQSFHWYISRKYQEYPGLLEALKHRHIEYNETMEYLYEEEEKGNILIISPREKLKVARMDRNKRKLMDLYKQGYQDTAAIAPILQDFLAG
ncbi:patatin-like phospholipase family protein [Gracilibacillus phocaeensis]|uniref:patatin-like phospholipase family protein n=1 Tax=Gracilibacillus phocaeensis TaxID=2042304 RepID=UPI0010314548|nr:patatin family protein [Gracilibacillus phocaeensis]